MKVPIIILGLVSAGLAYGLYQRNSSAGMEAEQAVKQFETMSNQVAEVRTKLALEQGTSIQTLSNAQYAVTRRTSDLLQLSNRLVQTTLLVKASQAEAREAHASLQSKAAVHRLTVSSWPGYGVPSRKRPPPSQAVSGR